MVEAPLVEWFQGGSQTRRPTFRDSTFKQGCGSGCGSDLKKPYPYPEAKSDPNPK